MSDAAKHLFKDRLMARVTPTFYFFRNGARPLLVAGCRVEIAAQSPVLDQGFPPALFLHCCGGGALSAARPWWAEALHGLRLYVWEMAQSLAQYSDTQRPLPGHILPAFHGKIDSGCDRKAGVDHHLAAGLLKMCPTCELGSHVLRAGELVHTHTGANKSKLEYLMRQHLKPREKPQQELFPVQATPTAAGPR